MKNIKSNTLFSMIISALCKPINIVIGMISVRILLNYLGSEVYGVWATLLSIISWFSYFDIGIGNGLRNRLTNALYKGDGSSRKLVSSAYAYIMAISFLLCLILCIIAFFINWNSFFGVSHSIIGINVIVYLCIILGGMRFVASLYKNVLFAIQKAEIVSIIDVISQILVLGVVFLLYKYATSSLLYISLVYLITPIVVNAFVSLILFFNDKTVSPSHKYIDLNEGKNLTNLGLKFFVIQICGLILFSTDSIIISLLYGASEVTPYNTLNKVMVAICGVYSAFLAPVWNYVTKAKAENEEEKIVKIIKRLWIIMLLFDVVIVAVSFYFRAIVDMWLGQEIYFSNILIFWGMLYAIMTNWCNTYAYVANGLELMKASMLIAIIEALLNVPTSLFLAEIVGWKSGGVLAGTTICMSLAAFVYPFVINKTINDRKIYVI